MLKYLKYDIVDTLFLIATIVLFIVWLITYPEGVSVKIGGFLALVVLKLIKDIIWQGRLVDLCNDLRGQLDKFFNSDA